MFLFILDASTEWLSNSSFCTKVSRHSKSFDLSSDSSTSETLHDVSKAQNLWCNTTSLDIKTLAKQKEWRIDKKHKKRRKKHVHESKHKPEYEQNAKNIYFEDKHRDEGNNLDTNYSKKSRPFYDISTRSIGFIKHKQPKKDIFQRYYFKNIDFVEALKKKEKKECKEIIRKETSKRDEDTNKSLSLWCKNIEEEQKNKTQEYNEHLVKDPHNIKLWLQYVDFQVLNKLLFLL